MKDYDPDIDGLKDELEKMRYTPKWWRWVGLRTAGTALIVLGMVVGMMAAFDALFVSPPIIQECIGFAMWGIGALLWYLAHRYHMTRFEEHLSAVLSLKILEEE